MQIAAEGDRMSQAQTGERTWLDERADQFEHEWKHRGERPRIEDYLDGQNGAARRLLLGELFRVERELRENIGEHPSPDEYLARFPDDGDVVEAAFGLGAHRPPPASEPPVAAAHSLLFGLLALQNNFIDRDTLLAAFSAWVTDKSRSLGHILLDRGALSPARHAVLQVLVQEHLQQHGFDPERSLAEMAVGPAVREELERLPDLDLQSSLIYLRLAAATAEDTESERTSSWDDESAATDTEGRFQIVRFHDRGALGEVYVARDQQLHRIVALKRIKLDHSTDRDKRARFVVEAEITGRLEHPGIVPVYGLGTYDDGRPFYAMRFIRGDNLKSAIEQFHQAEENGGNPGERNLGLLKLLRRFLDVCNAIDYAHSRGVLHRDLKPGNIMLGKFGETLVVDWGLAKTVGRSEAVRGSATLDDSTLVPQSGSDLRGTELGARLGTPAYMSPEQAAGRIGALGPASDVYSLGATLYCLLTGQAPFKDADIAELLRKVERGDFSPPRNLKGWIDPALEAICLKAMATDPVQRYRTSRALADDVEHWLADEPLSAWSEPISRRLRRWGRRHRLLVTGLGATLTVAVAALATGNVLVARQRDRAERNLAFAHTVVDEMYTGIADKLDDEKEMDDYQREILEKALKFYERFALPQSHDPRVRLEAAHAGMRVGGIRARLGETAAAEEAYRQALRVLSGLLSDGPAEVVYRDALAQAHRNMGSLFYRNKELMPEAEREVKEAVALWDALAREKPEIAAYRSSLADARGILCSIYTGYAYSQTNRVPLGDAQAQLLLALDAAERLAREGPGLIAYQELLADVLQQRVRLQSILFESHGEASAEQALRITEDLARKYPSEASAEQALRIAEDLARKYPEVMRHQRRLARVFFTVANEYERQRKFAQAEVLLKRCIGIMEKLAAEHPRDFGIANTLGEEIRQMADVLLVRGENEAALEWSGRAIAVYRSLARRDPVNVSASRSKLWQSLATRAETFMRLGRHDEAAADFVEVIELTSDVKACELFRAFHALTRARLGDLSALGLLGNDVREVLKVGTGGQPQSPYIYYMVYYDAACIHAALAKLALQDGGKSRAERQRLAGGDVERALEFLDNARASAEFKRTIRLDEVQREPLLDPLRANPRFQLLMMDLAFPDNPFGSR
jgi:tRNA A-37 threonylcarbamoyl transferase component Bud32